ncbi:MAG: anhydro-N-acetylmuramic acid kinase [Bryobacteraceae bacterium]
MRVAGVMSGTSLDGIDVAIVKIRGHRFQVESFRTFPYPRRVRQAILNLSSIADLARLHFLLGELYAEAVLKTSRECGLRPDLIACHGQTVYHQGRPTVLLGRCVSCTLQIGEAAVIAERTGLPVVSDFRPRDLAAGGQGAPLVPYVDYLLFRHERRCRAALNIGGIANVTILGPGARPQEVIAFDTGPGNMVIDALVERYTNGRQKFDRGGRLARKGRVDDRLLDRLLSDPYYRLAPPKTAGREQYGAAFVERLLKEGSSPLDLIATATAFTAAAVALGLERFAPEPVEEVIVSGGGAHNERILDYLRAFLPQARVSVSSEYGIDPDAKEAVAFAILGYQTWRRCPSNLPAATGARRAVVLGKLTP